MDARRRSIRGVVRWSLAAAAMAAGAIGGARSAHAQATAVPPSNAGEPVPTTFGLDPTLSLDPTLPQIGALPGGTAPAYGTRALSEGEWRFDFHGFITAPLNAGFNKRLNPMAGQSSTVLHAPPVVP